MKLFGSCYPQNHFGKSSLIHAYLSANSVPWEAFQEPLAVIFFTKEVHYSSC